MIPLTTNVRVRPKVLYHHHCRFGYCPRVKELIRRVRQATLLTAEQVMHETLTYNPISLYYVNREYGYVYVCRKAMTANRIDVIDVWPTLFKPMKETA